MKRIFLTIFFICWLLVSSSFAENGTLPPIRLNLTKAMQLASLQNAQVLAANQRVRQAISNIAISRSGLMPQVTGVFGGKRQTTDLRASGINLPGDPQVGPFNSFDTRARLRIDLLDIEVIERLKTAKATQHVMQAQYNKIRQDILVLTGALFIEAQRAHEAVALSKVLLKEKEDEYVLVQLRVKQGSGALIDVKEAAMHLEEARYRFTSAKVSYQEARMDLNALLGFLPEQLIVFEEDTHWANQPLTAAGPGVDVIVSQEQVNVSQSAVREVRSGFLPKLTASGDYGRLGESPSDSSRTYSLGLALSIPIWEGGYRHAQLRKAKEELTENEILLKDAFHQHEAKIKKARERLLETQAFLNAQRAQLNYARHQHLIVQGRFQSGLASRMDVLKSASFKALSLDRKNEAQALYWTARINLAAVLGRLEELFDIKERGNTR